MAKLINFVYIMLIFLSFLLVISSVNAWGNECVTVADCRKNMCNRGKKPKCYYGFCVCF
uniref:Nodule-specific cysteine-rich peptide G47 n=1 Tax=Pisum sativum TaxID=3888 RepID=A0A7T8DV75_PEA|nr:nodule-specific cysteine-rich peptide G47 [Pisum sativum]